MPRKRNKINIKTEPFEFDMKNHKLTVRKEDFNIDFLLDLCADNKVTYTKQYKSKYNSYVVYDYEPFCVAGFEIIYTFHFQNDYDYLFFLHRLQIELKKRVFLEECLLLEVA